MDSIVLEPLRKWGQEVWICYKNGKDASTGMEKGRKVFFGSCG